MAKVIYDARPLKPETRHWGVGEVVLNLVPELEKQNVVKGLSNKFKLSHKDNLDTWPNLSSFNKLVFEFSPLFTGDFDVYWGTNTFIPGFFLNKPSVVTVHDLILFDLPEDQRGSLYFQQRFVSSIKRAHAIIADSKTSADSLIKKFPFVKNKIEVGLLGCETQKPNLEKVNRFNNKYKKPYVIMLGAHRARKKLDLAIKAVQKINDSGIELDLLVVGNIHPSFEQLVNQNRSFIKTTGVIERSDMLALLCNAQALLFPTNYEGFGLPVLEAMAMSCPVIASNIPIIEEISGGKALLIDENFENWVKAIKKILSEKSYRQDLIALGKINLQRFSWQNTGKVYNDVISKISS